MPISNIHDISSAGKGFSNSALNNRGGDQSGNQFTVDGAPREEQLAPISDKNAGSNAQTTMGQKDLIPLAVTNTRNQTLAVETVKDIIDTNLLSTAKMNGYTELVGELENLSATLYIPSKDLVKEILEQEKQNTMFSGDKFYDLLREIAKTADPDQKEAIGNMLKAINFSQNRNEITNAVSSNLRFLAEYFSPNKGLSAKLSELADMWGSDSAQSNFQALRDRTADLMQSLSESLLNDSHTQTLLPIITHNLSKYNTNSSMLREYFNQLQTLIPSYEMRNELSRSFEALLAKLIKSDPMFSYMENDGQLSGDGMRYPETGIYQQNAQTNDQMPFTHQNPQSPDGISPYNYTTEGQKNQVQNDNSGIQLQPDKTISSYLTNVLGNNDYFSKEIADTIDFSPFRDMLRNGLSTPRETIKDVLDSLIEDSNVRAVLDNQLSAISSPAQMVDFLNSFLEAMPDGTLRDKVYEVLEEAVGNMDDDDTRTYDPENVPNARNGQQEEQFQQMQEKKSSSIQALTDFVEKNINHPALKSIDSFNASNLLQSMINAPGVMTPLAHYILPIQVENTRAFGELWVDNNDESGVSGKRDGSTHHHLFLTFDVDTFGRFEVDVYANDRNIRVSLLHPTSFSKNISSVVEKINRIAAGTSFSISDFSTGVLTEPHSLTQIFPKLNERRAGLNVKA